MYRLSGIFSWSVIVLVATFFGWLLTASIHSSSKQFMMPTVAVIPENKATVAVEEKRDIRLPEKPKGQSCFLSRYEGNATIKGWYEQTELYGQKMSFLRVMDGEQYKLPEKVQTWADGSPMEYLALNGVGSEMDSILLKANAQEPVFVDLVAVDVYCEGPPIATIAQK